ncbi:MAG: PrsW family intramembrane metalloprotease [Lachnospiraceae bacterium]|nr:PrsW family intramembrane metalloprotease [Lachnospiraceae bacterium]
MFLFLFGGINPFLIAAAVIPAIFLMIRIYKADRLEAEPKRLLVSLVIMGILSTIMAIILESVGEPLVGSIAPTETIYNILLYFIVVALSEEAAKYLFLRLRTWKSPEFNCQFDGVVYATFVSLGFALAENVGYVLEYGFGTALLRAVTAIPGHACFGVFMGAFYGAAKRYEHYNIEQSRTYRILSLVVPVLLHGTYDFIATQFEGLSPVFLVFVALLFVASYKIVVNLSRRDDYIDRLNRGDDPYHF